MPITSFKTRLLSRLPSQSGASLTDRGVSLLADQLDAVAVRVADEGDAGALGAAAGAVGGLLRLDPLAGQLRQGAVEVVDEEGGGVCAGDEGGGGGAGGG